MLVAMTCTVIVGFLLLDKKTAESTNLEMRQYLSNKPKKTVAIKRSVYNPFALASDSPATVGKSLAKKDWLVADTNLNLDVENRNILNDIVYAGSTKKDSKKSIATRQAVENLFTGLKSVKLALVRYYTQHQRWPDKLSSIGIGTLPTGISSIELSRRGTLTVNLPGGTDVIRLSPNTSTEGLAWFCQTTLKSQLLGRGSNRLCIENSTMSLARQLQ